MTHAQAAAVWCLRGHRRLDDCGNRHAEGGLGGDGHRRWRYDDCRSDREGNYHPGDDLLKADSYRIHLETAGLIAGNRQQGPLPACAAADTAPDRAPFVSSPTPRCGRSASVAASTHAPCVSCMAIGSQRCSPLSFPTQLARCYCTLPSKNSSASHAKSTIDASLDHLHPDDTCRCLLVTMICARVLREAYLVPDEVAATQSLGLFFVCRIAVAHAQTLYTKEQHLP